MAAGAAMTFLLDTKLYRTMGLSWVRRRCDGRPRPLRDGERAVRREACACGSIPEGQLPLRRIHRPSKEHSSLRCPLFACEFRSFWYCDAPRQLDAARF